MFRGLGDGFWVLSFDFFDFRISSLRLWVSGLGFLGGQVEAEDSKEDSAETSVLVQEFLHKAFEGACEGMMVKALDGGDGEAGYAASKRSDSWLKVSGSRGGSPILATDSKVEKGRVIHVCYNRSTGLPSCFVATKSRFCRSRSPFFGGGWI